jgi:hypothetical protein
MMMKVFSDVQLDHELQRAWMCWVVKIPDNEELVV